MDCIFPCFVIGLMIGLPVMLVTIGVHRERRKRETWPSSSSADGRHRRAAEPNILAP